MPRSEEIRNARRLGLTLAEYRRIRAKYLELLAEVEQLPVPA